MIEIKNLSVSFGQHSVLENFRASIPFNGTTVISGPSGCGKTTLLRVLMGLQKPDSGVVTGLENKKLSVVFQEDRLLPWMTALENVALISDQTVARDILLELDLDEEALRQRPDALSGGMKRRVALARALAYDGDLLLLDEPFTGLGRETELLVAQALRRRRIPMVLVTHSKEEAEMLGARNEISLSGSKLTDRIAHESYTP